MILRLLPLLLIAAVLGIVFLLGLDDYLSFEALKENRQWLLEWTMSHKFMAIIAFCLLYTVSVAVSMPGAIWLTLVGGFIFGTVEAVIYTVISATLGAVIIFLVARYSCSDFFCQKAGPMIQKMSDGFKENALSYLLVLRLVPLFPFWLVNLVPALMGVPIKTYIIGTFFGIIPGTVVYCGVGSGLASVFDSGEMPDMGIIFKPEIIGPILGLALLSLLPIVYKKYKSNKES